jgi:ankyrin repeat protein
MQTIATEAEEGRYATLQQIALDFARNGETEPLVEMIRHGLPVNLADARGNSLLMLASYNGEAATTRMLLEHGADVDRPNDRGQTPLGGAAFKGCEDIVALLLAHGADIDADNGGGMTPLMFAAMFGRTQVVEQLKARGASLQRRNRLGVSARFMMRLARPISLIFGRKQFNPSRRPDSVLMKTQLPSLITSDAKAGMTLACQLAEQLQSHHEEARDSAARPGGMNYLLPPNVSVEVVSSILFYAIAAANNGWANAA